MSKKKEYNINEINIYDPIYYDNIMNEQIISGKITHKCDLVFMIRRHEADR